MSEEMGRNQELRNKISDLAIGIANDIDHGECFYDSDYFKTFVNMLDELEVLSYEYFLSNKKIIEQKEN